jgi:hypothetical protein
MNVFEVEYGGRGCVFSCPVLVQDITCCGCRRVSSRFALMSHPGPRYWSGWGALDLNTGQGWGPVTAALVAPWSCCLVLQQRACLVSLNASCFGCMNLIVTLLVGGGQCVGRPGLSHGPVHYFVYHQHILHRE